MKQYPTREQVEHWFERWEDDDPDEPLDQPKVATQHTSEEREAAKELWKKCFKTQERALPLLLKTLETDFRPFLRDNVMFLLMLYVNDEHLDALLKALEHDEHASTRPPIYMWANMFRAIQTEKCISAMMTLYHSKTSGPFAKTVASRALTDLLGS